MEFKEIFLQLRKEKGIGQHILAKELGVSNAVVSHWETGRNEPTLQMIKRIADYFSVSADYLLGRED